METDRQGTPSWLEIPGRLRSKLGENRRRTLPAQKESSKEFKFISRKWLGKDVGEIVGAIDVLNFNSPIEDLISKVVIFDGKVFRTCAKGIRGGKSETTLVIFVDGRLEMARENVTIV